MSNEQGKYQSTFTDTIAPTIADITQVSPKPEVAPSLITFERSEKEPWKRLTDKNVLDDFKSTYNIYAQILSDWVREHTSIGKKAYVTCVRTNRSGYLKEQIGRVFHAQYAYSNYVFCVPLAPGKQIGFNIYGESLRPSTKEEIKEAERIIKNTKEVYTVHLISGMPSIETNLKGKIGYFSVGPVAYCCGIRELGSFSDYGTKKLKQEYFNKAAVQFLEYWKRMPIGGMVATFVKKAGQTEYQSKEWMIALKKAGFKRVGLPYENKNHPGNILSTFFYSFHPEVPKKKSKETI